MMARSIARTLVLAVITPLVLLGASALVLWFQIARMQEDQSCAEHSQIVLRSANDAIFEILSMQTSVRGYQLTTEPAFLETVADAKPDDALETLIALVHDNPSQITRAEDFRRAFHAWNSWLGDPHDAKMPTSQEAKQREMFGRNLMVQVRS
ncbi:MAG: CHASE3 domain-containing protein, partial [Clostridia bacterium]|nr:CHASE3 domain-containing protein [Deltaproteobacteria bacterium]